MSEQTRAPQEAQEEEHKQAIAPLQELGASYVPEEGGQTPGGDDGISPEERWKTYFQSSSLRNQLQGLDDTAKDQVLLAVSSILGDSQSDHERVKNVLATFANCEQPGPNSQNNPDVHVNAILRQLHLLYEEHEKIIDNIRQKV